ncbi:MAG TPA: hypothetical protein DEB07_00400 [Candidatus Moranbacteria bacterium]|nr:hypothetical protein [Candidatus Moranbacteria bacterium]HBU24681.1 hypothetical protein [Candidatus Moranbacteria bacterium]
MSSRKIKRLSKTNCMSIIYKHDKAVESVLCTISKKYSGYNKFLDVGCGYGDRTLIFKNSQREIIGIDYINYHSKNYKDFTFLNRNFFNSGFSQKSFDIIFCFDVLEHMEKPERLLSEIHSLLRPGGICILSTPNKLRILGAILIAIGKRKFPYCLDERNKEKYPEYWHIKEYTGKELRQIASDNGFQVEKFYKVFYGLTGGRGFKFLFNLPFYHNSIIVMKKS